jgi:hypothetical protein
MSFKKYFAGVAALSLTATPIAAAAADAPVREAPPVVEANELGGESSWVLGALAVIVALAAIILIADDDDPVSV